MRLIVSFMLSSLLLLCALSLPALAGAPPMCETDEECQEMGYDACDSVVLECIGGEQAEAAEDAYECYGDAGCPDGWICMELSSASFCAEPPSAEEDATEPEHSEEAPPERGDEASESAAEDEVSSACQGSENPLSMSLIALALLAFLMRRSGRVSVP